MSQMKFIILLFLSFINCHLYSQGEILLKQFQTEESDGVIFHKDRIDGPNEWLTNPHFTPSEEEILVFEKLLKGYIKRYNKNKETSKHILSPLVEQKRQYFGYIQDKKRILLVRFIPKDEATNLDWQEKYVSVNGDTGYIKIKFDIKKQSFIDIYNKYTYK